MSTNRALSPHMIGRQAHMQELEHYLSLAHHGAGQIVVVAGDAGIGKTRLLREFANRARSTQNIEVLEGHCYDEDPKVPYGPFVSAVRSRIRTVGVDTFAQTIAPWLNDLALLLPELGAVSPVSPDVYEPQLQKQRLFAAMYHALRPQSEWQCRIVVLEDLHWSDQTSQELIRYLVRSIERDPLLIVGSYRTDELHRRHPLTSLVAHLKRERIYHEVRLVPLSCADLANMLETTLDHTLPHAFVDALYAHTEGNPFFVEEALKSLIEHTELDRLIHWRHGVDRLTVPASVKDNILSRITDLDDATADVLRYAAVVGRNFDFDLLLSLTGLSEVDLLQAVTRLVERQLVEEKDEDEDCYRFRHALTRETVYDDLLGRERRMKHREVLQALEESYHSDDDCLVEQLAYHSGQARESAKAAHYAQLAGERAIRMHAYREAITHYEAALDFLETDDLAERARLLERLAECIQPIGDMHRYARYCREAQRCYEQVGNVHKVADLHRRLGRMLWDLDDHDAAFEHTWTALALLEHEPPSHELAMVYSGLSQLYMISARAQESVAWGEKALDLAKKLGDVEVETHALNNIGASLIELGDIERGLAYLERSLELALRAGMISDVIRAYGNLSNDLGVLGDYTRAAALLQEGVAFAERVGWETGVRNLMGQLGWIELELGHWDKAHALLDSTIKMSEMSDTRCFWAYVSKGELLLRQGYITEAQQFLEDLLSTGESSDRHLLEHALAALARVYLASNNVDQAVQSIDRCIAMWREHWSKFFHCSDSDLLCYAIDVYVYAGRLDQAKELYTLLKASSYVARPYTQAWLEEVHGLFAASEQRYDAAATHFQQAAERWNAIAAPFDEAQARRRLGENLLQTGDTANHEQAWRELSLARSIFERLGAPLELAAIDTLMKRCALESAAPPPADTTGPAVLTRREREVIRLLVRGYSNREIASELVISAKTAEVHVSNILGKLGVTSRAQAAAYAVEHGLAELSAPERVVR